jgi:hypothetical protein
MKPETILKQVTRHLRQITVELKLFVEKRIQLMMLNVGEHFSGLIASASQVLSGAIILFLGLCFLLVALAIFLSNLLEIESIGYVIVAALLFIVGFCFLYFKPMGVFKKLQLRLESEVIEVVNKTAGEIEQKKLEAHKPPASEMLEEENIYYGER